MKFCGKCGNKLEEGMKFCDKCGAKISTEPKPFVVTKTPSAQPKPQVQSAPIPASKPTTVPQPKAQISAQNPVSTAQNKVKKPEPKTKQKKEKKSVLPAVIISVVATLLVVAAAGAAVFFFVFDGDNPFEKSDSGKKSGSSQAAEENKSENEQIDISGWTVNGIESKTYTGKPAVQNISVTDGSQIADVDVEYINNKNAGTAVMIIKGKDKFVGEITARFKIKKADNTAIIKAKSRDIKAASLKKNSVKFSAVSVKKAKGKVVCRKASGNSKITVYQNGKILVKKGVKKGTYSVKVKVIVKGDSNYKSVTKKVNVRIKVK